MSNGSQWTWKWAMSLIVIAIVSAVALRALGYDARIQVLEAEKGFIVEQLREIKEQIKENNIATNIQLDRLEGKINKIDRNNP